jgi:hypothetical protein
MDQHYTCSTNASYAALDELLTFPVMAAGPAEAVKLKKLATPGWITRPVPVPRLLPARGWGTGIPKGPAVVSGKVVMARGEA